MDGKYDWEALFDRIGEGMTTEDDEDVVRDLYEKVTDLETQLAKFTDDELFSDAGE